MIKKVTITKVYKGTTKKDGTPYVISTGTNAGKNFTRIGIQTDTHGEKTYYNNALSTDKAMTIEEGQALLLSFTETVDGDNTWLNFNFPSKDQLSEYANSL